MHDRTRLNVYTRQLSSKRLQNQTKTIVDSRFRPRCVTRRIFAVTVSVYLGPVLY